MSEKSSTKIGGATSGAATNPSTAYPAMQVALLLTILLLKFNPDDHTGQFKSFRLQLDSVIGDQSLDPSFTAKVRDIGVFYNNNPHLFEAAHFAIKSLLMELKARANWGNCLGVSAEHIKLVSEMPNA